MNYPHLTPLMKDSIVKNFERGQRRYFPLKAKRMSQKALNEAFFIIYGRKPEDKGGDWIRAIVSILRQVRREIRWKVVGKNNSSINPQP